LRNRSGRADSAARIRRARRARDQTVSGDICSDRSRRAGRWKRGRSEKWLALAPVALPSEWRYANEINQFATFLKTNLPIDTQRLFRLLASSSGTKGADHSSGSVWMSALTASASNQAAKARYMTQQNGILIRSLHQRSRAVSAE